MKKLMIVQLGVILAFAASTTAFAGITDDAKSDKSSTKALGGKDVDNRGVRDANTNVNNSSTGTSSKVHRGDDKEDVRTSSTAQGIQDARATEAMQNIGKMDVGPKYAKAIEAIKNDANLSDSARIDAVVELLNKNGKKVTREEVLENCKKI